MPLDQTQSKPIKLQIVDTHHQTPSKWILIGANNFFFPLGGEVCGREAGSSMVRAQETPVMSPGKLCSEERERE